MTVGRLVAGEPGPCAKAWGGEGVKETRESTPQLPLTRSARDESVGTGNPTGRQTTSSAQPAELFCFCRRYVFSRGRLRTFVLGMRCCLFKSKKLSL